MKRKPRETDDRAADAVMNADAALSADDVHDFWNGDVDRAVAARPPVPPDDPPALQRLGPLPFPRGGFPLMGFLASVYDHVSKTAADR